MNGSNKAALIIRGMDAFKELALREYLQPEVTTRARALAGCIELHGARIAAQRLINEFS